MPDTAFPNCVCPGCAPSPALCTHTQHPRDPTLSLSPHLLPHPHSPGATGKCAVCTSSPSLPRAPSLTYPLFLGATAAASRSISWTSSDPKGCWKQYGSEQLSPLFKSIKNTATCFLQENPQPACHSRSRAHAHSQTQPRGPPPPSPGPAAGGPCVQSPSNTAPRPAHSASRRAACLPCRSGCPCLLWPASFFSPS